MRRIFATFCVLVLAGCGKPRGQNNSNTDHKAPAKIEDSFRVELKPTEKKSSTMPTADAGLLTTVTTTTPALAPAPQSHVADTDVTPDNQAPRAPHADATVEAANVIADTQLEVATQVAAEEAADAEPAASEITTETSKPPAALLTEGAKIGLHDRKNIVLKRAALDKEFLFSGLLVQDNSSFPISYMRARIVKFHEEGDQIYMLEAKDGQYLNLTISPETILASFPVTASTDEEVSFNFTEGFTRLYYFKAPLPSPDARRDGGQRVANTALNIVSSYIDDARMQDNQLIIHQVLAANTQLGTGRVNNYSFENTILIQPYNPDPSFVKRDTSQYNKVGYFQTDYIYNPDGTSTRYALHLGSKPITIYLSSNTPDSMVEPITRGLTYWNRIFGFEKIKVAKAESGQDARYMKYDHFVQWSQNENTYFAYANTMSDPRTGEVLKSIIYLPSISLSNAMSYARSMDRRNRGCISVAKFTRENGCANEEPAFDKHLAIDQRLLQKAMESRVHELAAHELGHVLGLRHNFAGSLAATYTAFVNPSLERTYSKELKAPDSIFPSSTVMDYLPGFHRMILGDFIGGSQNALSYDASAIRFLYYNEPFDAEKIPPYCTDEDKGVYVDCNADDTGYDFIAQAVASYEQRLKDLPDIFVYHFVSVLVDTKNPVNDPAKIEVDPDKNFLEPLFSSREILRGLFSKKTKELKIYRKYPKVDMTTEDDILKEEDSTWAERIRTMGGLARVFSLPTKAQIEAMKEQARNSLHSPVYATGIDSSGHTYALTKAQMDAIEAQIDPVFDALAEKIEKAGIDSIRLFKVDIGPKMRELLANYYVDLINKALFQSVKGAAFQDTVRSKNRMDLGHYIKRTVTIPVLKYDLTNRARIVGLLKNLDIDSSKKAQLFAAIKNRIETHVHQVLRGVKLADVDTKNISPRLARWVVEYQAIENLLKN